jgi:hypothetical protein
MIVLSKFLFFSGNGEHVTIWYREHNRHIPPLPTSSDLTERPDSYNVRGMDTPQATAPQQSSGGAKPPKIRYTHDAMIDMIIANPGISQNALASQFGYTPAWVSTVMCSDAFRARLQNRREELVDPALLLTIDEKFKGLVNRSLEVLAEKLSQPTTMVPDNLALRAAELGAKALGIGGNAPPATQHLHVDHLAVLAGRLVELNQARPAPASVQTTYEGEAHEIKAA